MPENTPTRMGGVSADDMIAILTRERDEARHDAAQAHGVAQALERERTAALRAYADVAPENARLRALLREIEWVEAWDDEGAGWWFCAVCRCDKSDGHAPDCKLSAALEGR